MPNLKELTEFCNKQLKIKQFEDAWCINGLQVAAGKSQQPIQKIALVTSASAAVLQQAVDFKANVVIAHHGVLLKEMRGKINYQLGQRLRLLLANNMSLLAYHLPLDGQPEWGNNAAIAAALGMKNWQMVADYCVVGDLPKDIQLTELSQKCVDIFGQKPNLVEQFGEKKCRKIGICSGGGASHAEYFTKYDIDTFLTGEISEHHWHQIRELGLNLLACGHYATEKQGVINLGQEINKQWPDIEIKFFREDCPV